MDKRPVEELQGQQYTPVDETTRALDEPAIAKLRSTVPHWEVVMRNGEPRLRREFTFTLFADAVEFVSRVAQQAPFEEHHPRMVVDQSNVTLELWTPAVQGVSHNDFILALRLDDLYSRWSLIGADEDGVDEASAESFPASDPPAR